MEICYNSYHSVWVWVCVGVYTSVCRGMYVHTQESGSILCVRNSIHDLTSWNVSQSGPSNGQHPPSSRRPSGTDTYCDSLSSIPLSLPFTIVPPSSLDPLHLLTPPSNSLPPSLLPSLLFQATTSKPLKRHLKIITFSNKNTPTSAKYLGVWSKQTSN